MKVWEKIEQKDWEKGKIQGNMGQQCHGPGTEYELCSRDEALSHIKVKEK